MFSAVYFFSGVVIMPGEIKVWRQYHNNVTKVFDCLNKTETRVFEWSNNAGTRAMLSDISNLLINATTLLDSMFPIKNDDPDVIKKVEVHEKGDKVFPPLHIIGKCKQLVKKYSMHDRLPKIMETCYKCIQLKTTDYPLHIRNGCKQLENKYSMHDYPIFLEVCHARLPEIREKDGGKVLMTTSATTAEWVTIGTIENELKLIKDARDHGKIPNIPFDHVKNEHKEECKQFAETIKVFEEAVVKKEECKKFAEKIELLEEGSFLLYVAMKENIKESKQLAEKIKALEEAVFSSHDGDSGSRPDDSVTKQEDMKYTLNSDQWYKPEYRKGYWQQVKLTEEMARKAMAKRAIARLQDEEELAIRIKDLQEKLLKEKEKKKERWYHPFDCNSPDNNFCFGGGSST